MIKIINKHFRAISPAMVVTLTIAIASISGGCGSGGGAGAGARLKVAASILPLADFCRRVGGDLVEVEVMVPPGASPHTLEPTASQMRFLSEAKLLVLNGLELEGWAADALSKAGNPRLTKVETAAKIPQGMLIIAGETGEPHHGHEEGGSSYEGHDHSEMANEGHGKDPHSHDHGVYDPHVWLDPVLASFQVEAIRDALMEVDPERAQLYRDNAASFLQELRDLDAWVREQTASFARKSFVAFHSSWVYFARRYGLDMVGVVEEFPGREPSAADISKLLERMRETGASVIFAEPQFSPRAAQAVADASGGSVKVAVLDPLGDPGDGRRDTYVKLIGHDVEEMAAALW